MILGDLADPMRKKYPDREVCTKCLMTFAHAWALPKNREDVLTCPVCKRLFWCRGKGGATCYTMRKA